MALPSTANRSRGDLTLYEGTWRILYHPYGTGQQAKWVFDEATHNFLRDQGARRVTGSGDTMKIYSGQGDDATVLDMGDQDDINTYRDLYSNFINRQEGKPQSVSQSGMQQGQPLNLKELWEDVYPGIDFPDMWAISEFGGPAKDRKGNYITDASKYNEVIEALEARVGSLSQYGLDKDAGYQVIPLGDQYDSDIVISDGKVTKIGKTDTATRPTYPVGLSKVGDDLKGYDVLQQRSGELDPIKKLNDPSYIIDPKTMQPYFQQPDGSLQAAPIPSIDDQISMHLVDGNMDAAVGKANFRDRPTSMEYFNAAMEWARTPADIFTISALVRGIFEPTPGPMGQMRRVGAPPAWATQAWIGLQNSMGIPVESMTGTPGEEPGSVSSMMVASSSGLVPNNFASANSAPTTLDGGKTVTSAPATAITGDSTVQALDSSGNVVGTMTADMATEQGFDFSGSDTFEEITETGDPSPTGFQWQDSPFNFDDVSGLSDEQVSSVINEDMTDEQFDIAEQIFSDQGGVDEAGRYFNDTESLTNAINFHIAHRNRLDGGNRPLVGPEGTTFNIEEGRTEFNEIVPERKTFDDGAPDTGTPITGDALRQLRIDNGLDPDTGMPIEDVGESAEDRAARYQAIADKVLSDWESKQADIPAWMAGEEGIDIEGARSGPGPASSFARAVSGYQPTAPIDYDSEGGWYGSEEAINASWLANMIDVPGEGLTSRSQLNDPAYWERVGADYMADPVNARTFQQVVDRQAAMDYATQFPQGRYLDEFPYTFIPGSEPDVAASDLTPAGTQTFSRPSVFDPATGTYRTQTIEDATRQFGESLSGQDMRGRNLGDLATTSSGAPRPIDIVPTAAPQPSTIRPEERRWATEAFDTTPIGVGTPQPPAPIYYEEDDIAEYVPSAPPAPVFSTPTPTPVSTVGTHGASARGGYYPRDEPHSSRVTQAYDPDPIDPDDYAGRYYDEGANGMRTRERLSLVGESGPELALFPNGTEIIPLDREMKPDQKRRLRKRGVFADAIDSYQFGGYVGDMGPRVSDLPTSAQTMPAGITEIQSGRPTRAPRSLMRQAGMRAPSAQTISNLLPEEIGVYQEMGRLAGIPDKAFEREFRSMVPMGQGGTRQARFTPRSTGRTRYGSI